LVAVARHLDPKQLPEPMPEAKLDSAPTSRGWWLGALLFVGGGGALGGWLWPTHHADHVSEQERTDRQAAFTRISSLSVPSVDASSVDSVLSTMGLQPADQLKMKVLLEPKSGNAPIGSPSSPPTPTPLPQPATPPLRLVSVTLWDTHAQDGDVVLVSSGGYQREITLTNAVQTVSFPVSANSVVQFVGVHDGGGGITLGVGGPQQQVLMPIMSEGQTLTLPISN
jgi:hypothetical protein